MLSVSILSRPLWGLRSDLAARLRLVQADPSIARARPAFGRLFAIATFRRSLDASLRTQIWFFGGRHAESSSQPRSSNERDPDGPVLQ